MILVQVLCTASLVACLVSQVCSVCLLLRCPVKVVLRFICHKNYYEDRRYECFFRFERKLLLMGGTLNMTASFLTLTALLVSQHLHLRANSLKIDVF